MENLKPEQTTNPSLKPPASSLPPPPEPTTIPPPPPSPKPETSDDSSLSLKDKFCPKYTTFQIIKKST